MARMERRSLSGGTPADPEALDELVEVPARSYPNPRVNPSGGTPATLDEIEALMMQGLTMARQAAAVGETVKGVAASLRDQLQETARILGKTRLGR